MTNIDTSDVAALAERILGESSSSSRRKWWVQWLEEYGSEATCAEVRILASSAGGFSLDEARNMPWKKILRRGQGRSASAQARTNPIARDEAFLCEACGFEVSAHGRTARNHCPECLTSKHVDKAPGDRLAGCGGLMPPSRIERAHGQFLIVHRCETCGFERRNRVMRDGSPPDNWQRVSALAAKVCP